MSPMLQFSHAIHQNIVKKYQDIPSQYRLKYIIYEALKGSWSIGENRRHHPKLVMPVRSLKCSFVNIRWVNSNLMIPGPQVKLAKYSHPCKLVQQLLYNWNRIPILDGNSI